MAGTEERAEPVGEAVPPHRLGKGGKGLDPHKHSTAKLKKGEVGSPVGSTVVASFSQINFFLPSQVHKCKVPSCRYTHSGLYFG